MPVTRLVTWQLMCMTTFFISGATRFSCYLHRVSRSVCGRHVGVPRGYEGAPRTDCWTGLHRHRHGAPSKHSDSLTELVVMVA